MNPHLSSSSSSSSSSSTSSTSGPSSSSSVVPSDSSRLLKSFATTDGLLKGTAILSNLITTASISILPGFGPSGLFAANAIQMTIAGLLEIPTGILADRYGWSSAVKLALALKFLVTLSFLAAVMAADSSQIQLVWFFFTCEAIVDSFASSFLSGSYQVAYLKWYERRLARNGVNHQIAPPLFLSSFKFALPLRFLLPVAVTLVVLALQFLSRRFGIVGSYTVAYSSIAFILALRAVVLVRVYLDFRGDNEGHRPAATSARPRLLAIELGSILKSGYFPAYVTADMINVFASFYLVGQVFKLFNESGLAKPFVWTCGIVFGLSLYFIKTLFGYLLFPRLSRIQPLDGVANLLLVLGLSALVFGSVLAFDVSSIAHFAVLFFLAIVCIVLSDAIQRFIDSNLTDVCRGNQATWISAASGLGMLVFGIVSGSILVFGLSKIASPIFCLSVFLLCMGSLYRLVRGQATEVAVRPFSHAIAWTLGRSIALAIVIFSVFDIVNFSVASLRAQEHHESVFERLVADSVQEPVSQGSFVEAARRLAKLKTSDAFLCAELNVWDFKSSTCDSASKHSRTTRKKAINIAIGEVGNEAGNDAAGSVVLYFDRSSVYNAIFSRFLSSLLLFSVCGVIIYTVFRKFSEKIQKELRSVLQTIENDGSTAKQVNDGRPSLSISEFAQLTNELDQMLQIKAEFSRQTAIHQVAAQVSHDIRSPLSALNMVIGTLDTLPEEKRVIIRNATHRINDIANGLLQQSKKSGRKTGQLSDQRSGQLQMPPPPSKEPLLLVALLDSIVSEKRVQFREKMEIHISSELAQGYGLFSRLNASDFARALSNLIENSVEAITGSGRVIVSLNGDGKNNLIRIQDTGIGIPNAWIANLGQPGESHGKEGSSSSGSGLGLFHARKTVEEAGGRLLIESEVGQGTTVTLSLPSAPAPQWFVEQIRLAPGTTVISIDDDQTIHQIWDGRLSSPAIKSLGIKHVSFSSVELAASWVVTTEEDLTKALFLVDHEFLGHLGTGLEFIEQLNIANRSILVSSHVGEFKIRLKAEAMGLKLLPKGLAPFVPIEFDPSVLDHRSFHSFTSSHLASS